MWKSIKELPDLVTRQDDDRVFIECNTMNPCLVTDGEIVWKAHMIHIIIKEYIDVFGETIPQSEECGWYYDDKTTELFHIRFSGEHSLFFEPTYWCYANEFKNSLNLI